MNIKLLKFIVIFMGIAIIFGIIILCVTIYSRFQNISSTSDIKTLSIQAPYNMNYIDHEIKEKNIYISYHNSEKILIDIFEIKSGNKIKQIEILK